MKIFLHIMYINNYYQVKFFMYLLEYVLNNIHNRIKNSNYEKINLNYF